MCYTKCMAQEPDKIVEERAKVSYLLPHCNGSRESPKYLVLVSIWNDLLLTWTPVCSSRRLRKSSRRWWRRRLHRLPTQLQRPLRPTLVVDHCKASTSKPAVLAVSWDDRYSRAGDKDIV